MLEPFTRAAHAVVDGDLETLRALLQEHPWLVRARSLDSFRAPLLHFVAANGVPDELQRTPENAVAVCETLLGAGADPDALGESYGGGPNATALCLLVSSWHPFERGVQPELVRTLVNGGARVDGREDDGSPLATALVFGYTRAAEALVDAGARVDNVFFAAALGDLEGVRTYFNDANELREGALGTYKPPIPKTLFRHTEAIVQEALHYAVTHGREDVARFLLDCGADPNGRTSGHHTELPLFQAVFVRRTAIVPFLLARGADPRVRCNTRSATPLGYARQQQLAEIVELLEGA